VNASIEDERAEQKVFSAADGVSEAISAEEEGIIPNPLPTLPL
jgi:hypothetical protein